MIKSPALAHPHSSMSSTGAKIHLLHPDLAIPGYSIDRMIGEGGMAKVYLAEQKSLRRPVALKILSHTDTPRFHERFMNEGRCIAALQHIGVVTIHDLDQANGHYYIAMEYLPCGDLKAYITKGIKPYKALKLIARLANALDYVHQQGIVHRDLKPSNILFRDNGYPIITDFGIAKVTQFNQELTANGTLLGSPYYLSPEQARGDTEPDGRSDIYSLGIILYELLTGEKPFRGTSFALTLLAHMQQSVPRLNAELNQYQPLLDRMLAKNPADRFHRATEIVDWILNTHNPDTDAALITQTAVAPAEPAPETQPSAQPAHRRQVNTNPRRYPWIGFGTAVTIAILSGVWSLWTEHQSTNHAPTITAPVVALTSSIAPLPPAEPVQDVAPSTPIVRSKSPQQVMPRPPKTRRTENNQSPSPRTTVKKRPTTPVSELLVKARSRMKGNRLSFPRQDSALFYYRKVLAEEPGNPAALDGLDQIAQAYTQRAKRELLWDRHSRAGEMIQLGLAAAPNHQGLLQIQREIEGTAKQRPFDPLEEFDQ